jgi:hypothetical protein
LNNYFIFDCNIAAASAPQRNFRFLFKSPGTLRHGDLSDAIEESAAAVLAPDGIAIVCIDKEHAEVTSAFRSSAVLKQAADRLGIRITLCICQLDLRGDIILKTSLRNRTTGDAANLKNSSTSIFREGLRSLFSAHHVLVTAPPGFTFVKPSGQRSTFFIRTEDALTDVENVQFLSYALLHRIKIRQDLIGQPIEVICIDTMAIASVAYALRDLYCTFFEAPKPRVVSFHSHEGLEDFNFPVFGSSFCIISASSSMRLESLWRERSQCHASEVVTLLTFDDAPNSQHAIFSLKNVSNTDETQGLRDIRIAGERFAPEDLKPRKVLLRKDTHKSVDAERFAKAFTGTAQLVVQGCLPVSNAKVRPIFVDGNQLANNALFIVFLTKILQQKIPASIKAIICEDDVASQIIASKCKDFLKSRLVNGASLPIIKHSELEKRSTEIDKHGALLIITAVVGRGSKLLAISRDLRPIHTGARTYVIGAQVAETQAQISSLIGNLKYSAEGSLILVEIFSKLAIGDTLSASYRREHRLLSDLQIGEPNSLLDHRKERIAGTSSGMYKDPLLPCDPLSEVELSLRPDFAYWDFSYTDRRWNTPAVLATVAAMLQNARESVKIGPEHRLASDAFQQVVLDPENFARYNDGVIQGALLRAARPSELDYSSEPESSRYMFDLVCKIIIQHEQPQGEAALEFALALKSGSLKFSPEHNVNLISVVRPALQGKTPQKKLLRLLLEIDQPDIESTLPNEF